MPQATPTAKRPFPAAAAAERLRQAFLTIALEHPEPVPGRVASGLVERLLREAEASATDVRAFWTEAGTSLGPFEGLPRPVRQHLARAAHLAMLEFRLLSPPSVRRRAYGRGTAIGSRLLHVGWRLTERGHRPVGRPLLQLGRRLIRWARHRAERRLSQSSGTPGYETLFALALWRHCGCDAFAIIGDYVGDIPLDPRISPVYRDESRENGAALLVGIDALLAGGRLYLVECNVNPGVSVEHLGASAGEDELGRRLAAYAASRGYEKIDFHAANLWTGDLHPQTCLSRSLERRWREAARAAGVELRIVDAPDVRSPEAREAAWLPDTRAPKTLTIHGRDVASPISRLLGIKGKLEALLEAERRADPGSDPVPFPRTCGPGDAPYGYEASSRFPNLIVKDPREDMARGIRLYKSATLPGDQAQGPAVAFEYVPPDLFRYRHNEGPDGEYVSVFRVHLLLAADGPHYLGARRDIAPTPVPETLAEGPVDNATAYLANVDLGARPTTISGQEDRICDRFAIRVGRILDTILRTKFSTGLTVEKHRRSEKRDH